MALVTIITNASHRHIRGEGGHAAHVDALEMKAEVKVMLIR